MVWRAVTTVGAAIILVAGLVLFTVAFATPTTICTTTYVDGDQVTRECETDESLKSGVEIGLMGGATLFIAGLAGVIRFARTASRPTNILVGGALTVIGVYLFYRFGGALFGLGRPSAGQPSAGLVLVILLLALASAVIMMLGVWQAWRGLHGR